LQICKIKGFILSVNRHIPSDIRLQTSEETAYAFAQRVQKERIVADFTQEDLAKKSKIPYSAIVRFENTGEISFVRLIDILRALKKIHLIEEMIAYDPIKALDDFDAIEQRVARATKRRVRKNG
jgi:ribosome-binding protein aMBF1 (putative translation factor)